uniref:L-Fucosyltransferase n=1 Tax=Acrobeloides nanus TaxID=290746 RepID=A0A914C1T5_9BILA
MVQDFGLDCCKYEDPSRFKSINTTYLKLHKYNSNYFQAYAYFHKYQDEIREIYQCSPPIMANVRKQAKSLFGSGRKNKSTHFMCVHVRRTDFFSDVLLGTDEYGKNFTNPAIEFVYEFLQDKGVRNISIVFFGDDHDFIRDNIKVKHLNIANSYITDSQTRGEEICLANNYCDSMLLTASGSTFGWWMTYLMPEGSYVFYNSQVSDNGNFTKDIHDYDLFLPEWIRITVEDNIARQEDKWWHERNNLPLDVVENMVFP